MFVFGIKPAVFFVVVYNRFSTATDFSKTSLNVKHTLSFVQNLTASYDFLEDRNISIHHKPGRYVINFLG